MLKGAISKGFNLGGKGGKKGNPRKRHISQGTQCDFHLLSAVFF